MRARWVTRCLGLGAVLAALTPAAGAPDEPGAAAPDPREVVRIVVEVNGVPITASDVYDELLLDEEWLHLLQTYGMTSADQREETRNVLDRQRAKHERRVLDQLIDELVSVQAAAARGIGLTPEEEAEVERMFSERVPGSREELAADLEKRGISPDRPLERFRNSVLIQKLQRVELIGTDSFIRPEEIRTYFERNRAQFRRPGQIRFRHIWISHSVGREEARARIDECRAAVLGGADWNEVCKKHSNGAGAKEGGAQTWRSIEDGSKVLREALTGLEPGQVSEVTEVPSRPGGRGRPVRPGAFVIVLLDEWIEEGVQPLKEAEDGIRNHLQELRHQEVLDELKRSLREKATIRIRLADD